MSVSVNIQRLKRANVRHFSQPGTFAVVKAESEDGSDVGLFLDSPAGADAVEAVLSAAIAGRISLEMAARIRAMVAAPEPASGQSEVDALYVRLAS